jgi:hypothetical protein
MVNDNTGWVCGTFGKIYKTNDGWSSWSSQQSNTSAGLYSMNFYDSNTGWACGESGIILKTVNSGAFWKIDNEQIGTTLISIKFIDQLTGFCCGDGNIILKTTTGGASYISKVNESIPKTYSLSQNYPNPFNPITKIEFQVPLCHSCGGRNPQIIIKVYDLLGREVKTLINETMSPGKYIVSFDASVLSSGVYFYRMTAGEFNDVKRMIFIK